MTGNVGREAWSIVSMAVNSSNEDWKVYIYYEVE